jgi:hypothetical protein
MAVPTSHVRIDVDAVRSEELSNVRLSRITFDPNATAIAEPRRFDPGDDLRSLPPARLNAQHLPTAVRQKGHRKQGGLVVMVG